MIELCRAVAELVREAGVPCRVLQYGKWGWSYHYQNKDVIASGARLQILGDTPAVFTVTLEPNYAGHFAVPFDPVDPDLVAKIVTMANAKSRSNQC